MELQEGETSSPATVRGSDVERAGLGVRSLALAVRVLRRQ